jgi:hypothetical protein
MGAGQRDQRAPGAAWPECLLAFDAAIYAAANIFEPYINHHKRG